MPVVSATGSSLPLWPLYLCAAKSKRGGVDSKNIVDLVVCDDPGAILERLDETGVTDEAVKAFIEQCRAPGSDLEDVYPDAMASTSSSDEDAFSTSSLLRLLRGLTKRSLTEEGTYSTLIPAPNPFVIPAGRFRESYYWDSYWIILGLLTCKDEWGTDLALGIVRNFAHLVNEIGFVPNGFRTYYLNRSQPPMLAAMVSVIAERGCLARRDVMTEFLPVLKKELMFWRNSERTFVEESTGLAVSRYWSSCTKPRAESLAEDLETSRDTFGDAERERLFRDICSAAESGWDFSSRWMDERNSLASLRTTRVLPVDLNALLAKSERIVAEMALDLGDVETSETFTQMYREREAALRTLFWDDARSKWRDVLVQDQRSVGFARKDDEDYASDWVPLWCLGVDDLARRRRAVRSLEASSINQCGGVASSSVHTGQQWDWPNVWPPSQYFLAEGCWMVGDTGDEESTRLGDSIRDRYMASARRAWGVWNALPEKFDCTVSGGAGGGGEYEVVIGFGWSIGLALEFMHDSRVPA